MDDVFITGVKEKYPKELLKDRVMTEGNVVAILYKDLLMLDEINLKSEDFITQDGRFYFEVAKNIRDKKFNVIDEVTILSGSPDIVINGFEQRGGWQQIQNMIDIINDKNAETYLDNLYKENIILNLHNNGFNLLNPIDIDGKQIIPIKLFKKMSSEDVLDFYEMRLSSLGTGYSSKVLEEEEIEIDDEFLDSCVAGDENGIHFDTAGENIDGDKMWCLPDISKQVGGLIDGSTSIIGGYSSTGKSTLWITIIMALLNKDRKVLIISNEQKVKVFKISFLIWLLCKHFKYFNITKKKLLNGDINDIDKDYLKKAQKHWNDNYKKKVKFIAIPDADMPLVKKKVRENVLKYGYDTVLYDTLKIDIEGSKDDKHWMSLIKDSRDLDKMAKKYNIIMLCSLQLAINTLGKLFLDASVLSMSKQIKEVLENLLLMRTVYSDELDKENKKMYCRPFRWIKTGTKWTEESYEVDSSGIYRMLFIDKCRGGENSSDTGVAYLLKFDGSHGIFREECLCKPRHSFIQ